MENGHLGFAQNLIPARNDAAINFRNTVATANYGTFSVGDGAWDGTKSGFYAGSTLGTIYAANTASGFSGNLLDLQTAGSSKFKADSSGNITVSGTSFDCPNTPISLSSCTWYQAAIHVVYELGTNPGNALSISSSVFTDISSVTPGAGTWLLLSSVCIKCGGTSIGNMTGKLWDGTTTYASTEYNQIAKSAINMSFLAAIVTTAGSTTYKTSYISTASGSTELNTAPDNPPSGAANMSQLQAWRIG